MFAVDVEPGFSTRRTLDALFARRSFYPSLGRPKPEPRVDPRLVAREFLRTKPYDVVSRYVYKESRVVSLRRRGPKLALPTDLPPTDPRKFVGLFTIAAAKERAVAAASVPLSSTLPEPEQAVVVEPVVEKLVEVVEAPVAEAAPSPVRAPTLAPYSRPLPLTVVSCSPALDVIPVSSSAPALAPAPVPAEALATTPAPAPTLAPAEAPAPAPASSPAPAPAPAEARARTPALTPPPAPAPAPTSAPAAATAAPAPAPAPTPAPDAAPEPAPTPAPASAPAPASVTVSTRLSPSPFSPVAHRTRSHPRPTPPPQLPTLELAPPPSKKRPRTQRRLAPTFTPVTPPTSPDRKSVTWSSRKPARVPKRARVARKGNEASFVVQSSHRAAASRPRVIYPKVAPAPKPANAKRKARSQPARTQTRSARAKAQPRVKAKNTPKAQAPSTARSRTQAANKTASVAVGPSASKPAAARTRQRKQAMLELDLGSAPARMLQAVTQTPTAPLTDHLGRLLRRSPRSHKKAAPDIPLPSGRAKTTNARAKAPAKAKATTKAPAKGKAKGNRNASDQMHQEQQPEFVEGSSRDGETLRAPAAPKPRGRRRTQPVAVVEAVQPIVASVASVEPVLRPGRVTTRAQSRTLRGETTQSGSQTEGKRITTAASKPKPKPRGRKRARAELEPEAEEEEQEVALKTRKRIRTRLPSPVAPAAPLLPTIVEEAESLRTPPSSPLPPLTPSPVCSARPLSPLSPACEPPLPLVSTSVSSPAQLPSPPSEPAHDRTPSPAPVSDIAPQQLASPARTPSPHTVVSPVRTPSPPAVLAPVHTPSPPPAYAAATHPPVSTLSTARPISHLPVRAKLSSACPQPHVPPASASSSSAASARPPALAPTPATTRVVSPLPARAGSPLCASAPSQDQSPFPLPTPAHSLNSATASSSAPVSVHPSSPVSALNGPCVPTSVSTPVPPRVPASPTAMTSTSAYAPTPARVLAPLPNRASSSSLSLTHPPTVSAPLPARASILGSTESCPSASAPVRTRGFSGSTGSSISAIFRLPSPPAEPRPDGRPPSPPLDEIYGPASLLHNSHDASCPPASDVAMNTRKRARSPEVIDVDDIQGQGSQQNDENARKRARYGSIPRGSYMIIREESPVNRTRYPMSPTSMDSTEKYKATVPKAASNEKAGSSSTDEHRSRKRKALELDAAESLSAVQPGQSDTAQEPRPSKRPRHSSPTVLNDINNVSDPRLDGEAKARVHPRHSWPVAMHPHDRPQYDIVTSVRIVNVHFSERPHPKPSASVPTLATAHECSGVSTPAAIVEGKSHAQSQCLSSPPVVPAPDKVGAVSPRDDVVPFASTVKLSSQLPLHSLESDQAHEDRDQHTPVIEVESSGHVHRSLPQVPSPATIDKCLCDEVAQPSAAIEVETTEEVHDSPIPAPADGIVAVSSVEAREQPDHPALVPERVASQVEEKEPTTPAVIVSGPPEQSHRSPTPASVSEVAKGARFDWYALLAAPEEPKCRKRARARSPRIPADASWRTLWHLASDLRPTKRARHRSPSQPIQIVAAAPQDASDSTKNKTPDLSRVSPLPVLMEEETIAPEDDITSRQQAAIHKSVNALSAIEIEAEYDEEFIDYEVRSEADGIEGRAEIAYEHGTRKMPINQIEGELDYYEEDEESASPSGHMGQAAVFFDRGRTPSPMERSRPPSMSPGRFRSVSLLRTPSPPRASSSARAAQLPKNHRDYRPPSLPATPPPLDSVSPTTSTHRSQTPRLKTFTRARSRSFSPSPIGLSSRERPLASGPPSRLRRSERLRTRSQSLQAIPFHVRRTVVLPKTPTPLRTPSPVRAPTDISPSLPPRPPSPARNISKANGAALPVPLVLPVSDRPLHVASSRAREGRRSSGYIYSPPSACRAVWGGMQEDEQSDRGFCSEDEREENVFPYVMPLKYEYPVVEPLDPRERHWLARMHEQLEWAEDCASWVILDSRQAGERAVYMGFESRVLLEVAEDKFERLLIGIRRLSGNLYGCYLWCQVMVLDPKRRMDIDNEFEDDLLEVSHWDLYARQWDHINSCFRPYHHMPYELLYPKRPQRAVEMWDKEGYLLIAVRREFYEGQENKLREGLTKTREFIQSERDADALAELEARIGLIRQKRRTAELRKGLRWRGLSTFVPTGNYSTWPLPNWGKCAYWKDRRRKKNKASAGILEAEGKSGSRPKDPPSMLAPPAWNPTLLSQSPNDGAHRDFSRSPPRSRTSRPTASKPLSLSPPWASLPAASRHLSLSPPRSRISLPATSRHFSLSPPRSRIGLPPTSRQFSLSPPRSRRSTNSCQQLSRSPPRSRRSTTLNQQRSRSPPRTRRRSPGTIVSYSGSPELHDYSESENDEGSSDEDDNDSSDEEDDQPPEANLADPLLLSPPTDDDPRVLWAELVHGIVRWSRRFPNYPRKTQEKADVTSNGEGNTPAAALPDKEHVLCPDVPASTMPQNKEEQVSSLPSILEDESSTMSLLHEASPPLSTNFDMNVISLRQPPKVVGLGHSGPSETNCALGKRKRSTGDESGVRIRRPVQLPSSKRIRVHASTTDEPSVALTAEIDHEHTQQVSLFTCSPAPESRPSVPDLASSVAVQPIDSALVAQVIQDNDSVLDTRPLSTILPVPSDTQCIEPSVESASTNQIDIQQPPSSSETQQVDSSLYTAAKRTPLALGAKITISRTSAPSRVRKVDRYLGLRLVRASLPSSPSVEQSVKSFDRPSNHVRFADVPISSNSRTLLSAGAQLDCSAAGEQSIRPPALKRKRGDDAGDERAISAHRSSVAPSLSKRQRVESSTQPTSITVPVESNRRPVLPPSRMPRPVLKESIQQVKTTQSASQFKMTSIALEQQQADTHADKIRAAQQRLLAKFDRRIAAKRAAAVDGKSYAPHPINPVINVENDQSRSSTKRKRQVVSAQSRHV